MIETTSTASGLEVLHALRGVLRYHRELGLDPWPRGEELDSFLRLSPALPPSVRGLTSSPQRSAGSEKAESSGGESVPENSGDPAGIMAAVRRCSACELAQGARCRPMCSRPAEGEDPLRLMIVGTWPQGESGVFGPAEDEMVQKMITAMGLSPAEVYVTNAIKCGPAAGMHPAPKHALSCLTHLSAEITALRPQFLCLMGAVAVRSLLGSNYKVPQMRGRFHTVSNGRISIPALVTWHPSTLLVESGLKRAAWSDLQMLAKKMGPG